LTLPIRFTYSPINAILYETQCAKCTLKTNNSKETKMNLQGGSSSLQGGGNVQPGTSIPNTVGVDPTRFVDPVSNTSVLGASTTVDPAQAAAAAQAAADAARAASLRSQVSDLVNNIKGIFNQRYGMVDASAGDQTGKLNDRFATESGDLTKQIEGENQKVGAAHAASGTFDSSYRGNNQDTVTQAGQGQIRDLGQELQDNIAKIASWVAGQKSGFDAQKSGYDAIAAHLAEETDPNRLADLRATLDSKIADLKAGGADYNTTAQNATALNSVVSTSPRVVQLKTTLSQIVAGNADPAQKAAIGHSLITNAGLSPDEQQQLLQGFTSDLSATPKVDANGQPITA
jgi:hypothetical protein